MQTPSIVALLTVTVTLLLLITIIFTTTHVFVSTRCTRAYLNVLHAVLPRSFVRSFVCMCVCVRLGLVLHRTSCIMTATSLTRSCNPWFRFCSVWIAFDHVGNKIPFIENLGATQVPNQALAPHRSDACRCSLCLLADTSRCRSPQDQYDTLDLSDNEISKLENFPLLKRLRSVLLSNNRVSRIAANLASFLPNLETLILTNNRLTKLEDLDPLACLTSLRTLSLIDNPVTHQARYRLYVIHKLPRLRILDFRKIRIRV